MSELRRRLLRYRADRHPTEHAATQFHLGATLVQLERLPEAIRALETAASLFAAQERPVEYAKATNMLGVAHRSRGDRTAAIAAFVRAAGLFAEHDQPAEEGAAHYNLGLVHRDAEEEADAAERFATALDRFDRIDASAQASAAARELGTSRFKLGELGAAVEALAGAEELAERAGDLAALGGAANVRGLALLADGRPDDAVAAFEIAVGAHPRGLRPDGYAMAKANLALACERVGRVPDARLAARQATDTPGAPALVTAQAGDVLDRLGSDPDDLHAVLDGAPEGRWESHIRDEVVRWADISDAVRATAVGGWIDGQLRRPGTAEARATMWVEVLIEQPPAVLERVAGSTVGALEMRGPDERDRFRATVQRATSRLGVPQLMRFEAIFDRLAEEVGLRWR